MMRRRLCWCCLACARAPAFAAEQSDDEVDFFRAAQWRACGDGAAARRQPERRDPNGETGLIVAMRYESLKWPPAHGAARHRSGSAGAQRQHRPDDGGLPQNKPPCWRC
jgi:hypothetical protein